MWLISADFRGFLSKPCQNFAESIGGILSRIRYVKPTFFSDTQMADVSIEARLLYIGLWCHLDRGGICEYDTKLIKREVFPYDEKLTLKKIESLLKELTEKRRIYIVEYELRKYIYCPYLVKHQKFHKDEKPRYKIPQEILDGCVGTLPAPCQHPSSTLPAARVTGNGELKTGNGEREAAVPAPKTCDELFSILKNETLVRWKDLYPDDSFIKREVIKALGWCHDNPSRTPEKPSGWSRFLSRWLEKSWSERRPTEIKTPEIMEMQKIRDQRFEYYKRNLPEDGDITTYSNDRAQNLGLTTKHLKELTGTWWPIVYSDKRSNNGGAA